MANSIKIGSLDIDKLCLGSTEASALYLGSNQVYGYIHISLTATNCLINGSSSYDNYFKKGTAVTLSITADGTSYAVPETLSITGGTYVRADNTSASLVFSNITADVEATINAPTTTAVPTNLSVSDTTLSFDPVDGATSYEIYAKGSSGVETDLGEYTPA